MYRCHPQLQALRSLLESGVIGEVKLVEASFGYRASDDLSARIYRPEWGGGALLDVGCYPISMARWVAGATRGLNFAEPEEVKAVGVIGTTGVDLHTSAVLTFSCGMVAALTTSVMVDMPHRVVITGTEGSLTLVEPWLPSTPCRDALRPLSHNTEFPSSTIILSQPSAEEVSKRVVIKVDRDLFSYEIDAVSSAIPDRQSEMMSWEDSLGNLRALDLWRDQLYLSNGG